MILSTVKKVFLSTFAEILLFEVQHASFEAICFNAYLRYSVWQFPAWEIFICKYMAGK